MSNKSRSTPLPHLYYDSPPFYTFVFYFQFLTLFQCALDFTPHCHVDVFSQRLAFVPSLLRYRFKPHFQQDLSYSTCFCCQQRSFVSQPLRKSPFAPPSGRLVQDDHPSPLANWLRNIRDVFGGPRSPDLCRLTTFRKLISDSFRRRITNAGWLCFHRE